MKNRITHFVMAGILSACMFNNVFAMQNAVEQDIQGKFKRTITFTSMNATCQVPNIPFTLVRNYHKNDISQWVSAEPQLAKLTLLSSAPWGHKPQPRTYTAEGVLEGGKRVIEIAGITNYLNNTNMGIWADNHGCHGQFEIVSQV